MSFLGLEGKTYVVLGVANRRSVAWAVGSTLEAEGAKVIYSVRSDARRKSLEGLLAGRKALVCDVEEEGAADRLAAQAREAAKGPIAGVVHSVAFANYEGGLKAFHETRRAD
ncbi:MAG TPA: SDR family oxidoreductase, partial [Opitutaceae bacterium]